MRACAVTRGSELSAKELTFLTTFLKEKQIKGKHLEIGTAAGGTLCEMLSCYDLQKIPPFVVIDPMEYFPDQQQVVNQNLIDHDLNPDDVEFRKMTSALALKEARQRDERFDFIFVDGAHKIKYVTQDLGWGKLLNIDGYFCFHDYSPKYPGVFWTVNRFLQRHPNYRVIDHVETLLVLQKKSISKGPEVSWKDVLYAHFWSPWLQILPSLKKRLKLFFGKF